MTHPEWIQALVILKLTAPDGIQREIKNNPEQRKNSQYAFNFQKPGAEKNLTAEKLAGWVKDDAARVHYIEAFNRSDFEAMLNYYRAKLPASRPEPGNRGAARAPAPAPAQGHGSGARVSWTRRPGSTAPAHSTARGLGG